MKIKDLQQKLLVEKECFDNFLGSNLNKELFLDMISVNKKSGNRYENFRKKYNLSYLGEVLERYQERELVKSNEDLRTVLVFAGFAFANGLPTPDFNTNQLDVFISNVEKEVLKTRDIISISCLLQTGYFYDKIINDKKMCEIILEELKNNSKLSFEEKVWMMYSAWYYLNSNECFRCDNSQISEPTDSVKQELFKILSGIEIKPLRNINDYHLYLMLIEISSNEEFFSKSKNFKNKVVCNQYKKLVSLSKKEYTLKTISDVSNVLNLGNDNIMLFYNYIFSYYILHDLKWKTNITFKGNTRLAQLLLNFFGEKEKCPDIVMRHINSKIYEISRESDTTRRYSNYTPSKGYEKAVEIFLDCDFPVVALENMDKFFDIFRLDGDNYCFFSSKQMFFMLDEPYKDYFNKLKYGARLKLVRACLEYCKDTELLKRAYNIFSESLKKETLYKEEIKNLYKFKILDISSDYIYSSLNAYSAYLEYLSEEYSMEVVLDKMKEFYAKGEDIEKSLGYVGETSFYNNFNKVIYETICRIDVYQMAKENKDLAKKYQEFKDEIMILKTDVIKYCKYLMSELKNKEYVKLMDLTSDEVLELVRFVYKTMDATDRSNWSYSDRKFYDELKKEALTDEEKSELEIQELENLKKEHILDLSNTSNIYDFKRVFKYEYLKDEVSMNRIKEIFMAKIKDSDFLDYHDINNGYVVIKKFIENGLVNDNELLEFTKQCLKVV